MLHQIIKRSILIADTSSHFITTIINPFANRFNNYWMWRISEGDHHLNMYVLRIRIDFFLKIVRTISRFKRWMDVLDKNQISISRRSSNSSNSLQIFILTHDPTITHDKITIRNELQILCGFTREGLRYGDYDQIMTPFRGSVASNVTLGVFRTKWIKTTFSF